MAGLQNIRDNLGSPFIKIIVGSIVITFALFFGWGTVFSSSDANTVATVDGIKIDLYDLDLEMRKIRSSLERRLNDTNFNLEEEVLKNLSIKSLIRDTVVINYLNNQGIKISDISAYRVLSENETFLDDGKFIKQKVENFARQNGILPNKYLSNIKKDIALNLWASGLRESSFITRKDLENNLKLSNQTRDITFLKLRSSFYEKDLKLTDEEVLSFYNNNPYLFQTEEKAKVRFIEIFLEDIKQEVFIGEEEIEIEYKEYLEDFNYSITRSASHLMIKITDEFKKEQAVSIANSLLKKIQTGEKFEDLVAQYSEDEGTKDLEGDLGVSDGTLFPQEFESVLLNLKPGEVSDPVALDSSVHLLKLKQVEEPLPKDLDSMKKSLQEELTMEKAASDFSYFLESAADLSFSLNNLDDLSEQIQLEIKETDFFSRNKPSEIFNEIELLEKIFNDSYTQEGKLSELIELDNQRAIIFEVLDFQKQETKEFEKVKEFAQTELGARFLEEKMDSEQTRIIDLLKKGTTFKEISSQEGFKIETYRNIRRDSSLFPKEALYEIFNAQRPSKSISYLKAPLIGGDRLVFSVDAINESSQIISDEEKVSFKDFLLNERSMSQLADLHLSMLEVASVKQNRSN